MWVSRRSAVEREFFVAVQAGFVVALDFVFAVAHLAEAGVLPLYHKMRARHHQQHHGERNGKQLGRQHHHVNTTRQHKQRALHQFGQPREREGQIADVAAQAGENFGFANQLDLLFVRIHDAFDQLRLHLEHEILPDSGQLDLGEIGGGKIQRNQ